MATMTQKQMYVLIAEQTADSEWATEIKEFCDKKIAQLSKPRKSKSKPEVVEFRKAVASFLADQDAPVTNKMVAEHFDVSSQKSSSALRYLRDNGDAVEFIGEKKSDPKTYAIAKKDEVEQDVEFNF